MTQVFHSDVNNVAPWQATYSFPSQTTQSEKSMIKLNCKNGKPSFTQNDVIRFEFPSDQYLNALNSQISFDVVAGLQEFDEGQPVTLTIASSGTVFTIPSNSLNSQGGNFTNPMANNALNGYYICFTDKYGLADSNYFLITDSATATVTTTLTIPELLKAASIGDGTYSCTIYSGLVFQDGGAHALFSRIKVSYGGMVIEDIVDYNIISRLLLDCGVSRNFLHNTGAILEGTNATYLEDKKFWRKQSTAEAVVQGELQGMRAVALGNSESKKRICFRPFVGLLNCKKVCAYTKFILLLF